MRKIAVALSKGGVGKTTTAINLASGLARGGSRVLLIDLDTQGQAGSSLGLQPEQGLAELISGHASIDEATVEARERLWLLAGGRALAGLKRPISRKDYGGEMALQQALAPLEGRYDFVIMDTAPSWDVLNINAFFYAREVLAPVSLEILTLQGLLEFEKSLAGVQEYKPELQLKYILPTFLDRRVKKSQEILKLLQQYYGERVCSPIRYNVRLSEAPGYGQDIYEFAPGSPGAEDYQQLVERIQHGS